MDGWVTLGTKLDNKQLEKDLNKSIKMLERYEKESEKLTQQKSKVEIDISNSEKKLDVLNKKIENTYDKFKQENINLSKIPEWKKDTTEYQKQIEKVDKLNAKLLETKVTHNKLLSQHSLQNDKLSQINNKIKENATNQEIVKNKIEETKRKLGVINLDFKKIGESVNSVIKKVAKWALAIFSVRSAYMFVRQAASTLSSENEQIASDISNISSALANTMLPVIKTIINWIKTLMGYINYIWDAWFGDDLFKSSADNLKSGAGSAEKIKKSLAGFDEINIVSDNSSNGASGGVSSGGFNDAISSSKLKDLPKWVKVIAQNKEAVLAVLAGITAFAIGTKIARGINAIMGTAGGLAGAGGSGLLGLSSALKYLIALGVITISVVVIIDSIKKIKEATDEINNLAKAEVNSSKKFVDSQNERNKSLQEKFKQGEFNAEQEKQYIDLLLFETESNYNLIDSIKEQKTWYGALTGANEDLTEAMKIHQDQGDKLIETLDEMYKKGLLNETQTKKYTELLKKQIDKLHENNYTLSRNSEEYDKNKQKINELKQKLKDITGENYETTLEVKAKTSSAKNTLSNFFKGLGSSVVSTIFGTPLTSLLGKIAKLRTGGVINMPGRGVMVGSAIGGEAGPEGVIPLTNSQMMAQLGEAIGKYVNINATVPVYVGNRQIAREIKKISADNDFAFNR